MTSPRSARRRDGRRPPDPATPPAGRLGERPRALATLVAAVALLGGACTTSKPVGEPVGTASLSDELARFRASLAAAPVPTSAREGSASGRPSRPNVIGDAARPALPARPFPRALDPIPPLYRPPDRRLALQPILDVSRASPDGDRRSRERFVHPDPLGRADPLRRIDPVSGRDPLGRLDPTGGVDLAPRRSAVPPGTGLDARR